MTCKRDATGRHASVANRWQMRRTARHVADGDVGVEAEIFVADVAAVARQLDVQIQLAANRIKTVTRVGRTVTGVVTVHIVRIRS